MTDLYALAGRLADVEREMREDWSFRLVRERDEVLRQVTNLSRRERAIRQRQTAPRRVRVSLPTHAKPRKGYVNG